jgi:hypothetical protein
VEFQTTLHSAGWRRIWSSVVRVGLGLGRVRAGLSLRISWARPIVPLIFFDCENSETSNLKHSLSCPLVSFNGTMRIKGSTGETYLPCEAVALNTSTKIREKIIYSQTLTGPSVPEAARLIRVIAGRHPRGLSPPIGMQATGTGHYASSDTWCRQCGGQLLV